MSEEEHSNADPTQDEVPRVTLRVPGLWEGPQDFVAELPEGCELRDGKLILADGWSFELAALAADADFAKIFATGCSRPPSEDDQIAIENYKFNLCITGLGGSVDAAKALLRAGAAAIAAGGHGVFIDNCGLAHGSDDWLKLTEQEDAGGPFWAFVMTAGNEQEVYSVGMQVLGMRDAVVPRTGDDRADDFQLRNFLGFTLQSGEPLADGDLLGSEEAPMFRLKKEECTHFEPGNPFHNPFGQWRLLPVSSDEKD